LQRDYGLRDPAARPRVCANEQPGQRAYYQSWYQRSYKQQLTMASINLCALTVIALIAQHMECILLRNTLAVSQAFAPPIIGTAGGTRPPTLSFLAASPSYQVCCESKTRSSWRSSRRPESMTTPSPSTWVSAADSSLLSWLMVWSAPSLAVSSPPAPRTRPAA
jgi:hypothetical protein